LADEQYILKKPATSRLQRSLSAIASRSIRPELMAEGRRGGRAIGPKMVFWSHFKLAETQPLWLPDGDSSIQIISYYSGSQNSFPI
jgi:hypothetical protein